MFSRRYYVIIRISRCPPRKRRSPIRASLPAAVERAIEEARKTQIAVIRPSIDFARSCLEAAQIARDAAAARIGLQHARAGYELARRVLSRNSLGVASASLDDELTALRRDLEQAEARQTHPRVMAIQSRESQSKLTIRT